MIRPLRTRHRWMVLSLAVVVPALYVAGLVVRREIPANPVTPVSGTRTPLVTADLAGTNEVVQRTERVWDGFAVDASWLRATGTGRARAVTLEIDRALAVPDPLVYWDAPATETAELSADARLLGRLGGQGAVTWQVPGAAGRGRLVLYSAAWRRVVASAEPPQAWTESP